jgi:hypothetical protein
MSVAPFGGGGSPGLHRCGRQDRVEKHVEARNGVPLSMSDSPRDFAGNERNRLGQASTA